MLGAKEKSISRTVASRPGRWVSPRSRPAGPRSPTPQADRIQAGWKNIAEPLLMETVNELCSEKYPAG